MKTIYEIVAIEEENSTINAMAATKEKAENYLIEKGFEKITDTLTENEEYQTWVKKFEKTAFFEASAIVVTVKPYSNFIA